MARRALSRASLAVVQAVTPVLSDRPTRIGVSGGADSMALAAAVARVAAARPVEALVVDHGLWQGSGEHSRRVAAQVEGLGLPVGIARVEVDARDGGIESAARTARHHALWLTPATRGRAIEEVWLAHSLDDQAESVLLGLARGSGTRSLAGMASRRRERMPGVPADAEVVRPLLGLRRSVLREACADWGIRVWDDPANADPRFLRSAVRADAIPALVGVFGDAVIEALARTADLARADADALDTLAGVAAAAALEGDRLRVEAIDGLPEALRSRVVRGWLDAAGCPEVHRRHVAAVLELVDDWHGQGPLHLPGGVRVERSGGLLVASGPARGLAALGPLG